MYIVIYKNQTSFLSNNTGIKKFEYLDEAQEFIKDLVREGIMDVTLSQEIPMKLKVEVEF